jgi:hypothetical protein
MRCSSSCKAAAIEGGSALSCHMKCTPHANVAQAAAEDERRWTRAIMWVDVGRRGRSKQPRPDAGAVINTCWKLNACSLYC